MAYRIVYSSAKKHSSGRRLRVACMSLLFVTAFCLGLVWENVQAFVTERMLPGVGEITESFDHLAQRLSEGEPVAGSVTVFFRELMNLAEAS